MSSKYSCVLLLLYAICANAIASELSGKITIEKRLVKETVAATVYDLRGVTVSAGHSEHLSTNEFERVAVWLDSKLPLAASPVTAVMEQQNRRFQPALLIVPPGSVVNFPNLDPIFHNIFSLSRTESFDLGYYPKGHSRSVKFPRSGIVQVYCHVHPNMYAVIVVTSSPWSGQPHKDGTFSWTSLPAGEYTLNIWQKSVGLLRRAVIVPKAGAVHVNISLPDEESEN